MLRALFVFALALPAHALELNAPDIEAIERAVAEFYSGPLTHIPGASPRCTYTAEQGCEAETRVTVETSEGFEQVVVSKIDGQWTVGQWQREVIAFRACTKTKSHKECYGPSGKVGGMRRE